MVLVVRPVPAVGQQKVHVSNSGEAFSKVLTHANTAFRWLGIDCIYSSNYPNLCFMRRHCSSLSPFLVVVFMPRANKGNSHPLSGLPLFQLYLYFSPCKERIGSHGLSRAKGKYCEKLVQNTRRPNWRMDMLHLWAFGHCREGDCYHRCSGCWKMVFQDQLASFPATNGD